jgi:hypothetical protein
MQKVDWEKLAKNLGSKNLELEAKLEDLKNKKKRSEQFYCEKYDKAYKKCDKQCIGCNVLDDFYSKR